MKNEPRCSKDKFGQRIVPAPAEMRAHEEPTNCLRLPTAEAVVETGLKRQL